MSSFPLVPARPEGHLPTEQLFSIFRSRIGTLVALETQVPDLEAALANCRAQFAGRCGRLAAELAELEVEIARLLLERRPDDPVLQERLRRAEATAGRRRGLGEGLEGEVAYVTMNRSPEARRLYQAIARRIHPDLACDPEEAQARHDLMVHLNWLYAQGDLEGLHRMLQDCMQGGLEVDPPKDLAGYLAQSIAAMNRRIEVLSAKLAELERSDDALLREEMLGSNLLDDTPDSAGIDPYDRLAGELERRVRYTRQRVEQLRRPGPGR